MRPEYCRGRGQTRATARTSPVNRYYATIQYREPHRHALSIATSTRTNARC